MLPNIDLLKVLILLLLLLMFKCGTTAQDMTAVITGYSPDQWAVSPSDTESGYKIMSLPNLKAEAKQRGIKLKSGKKKEAHSLTV